MLSPTRRRQPDILEVIADLSNDEVRTPPRIANGMLDLLPDEVWIDPDLRWIDPGCKTGVFPREIAKRLMIGLADAIPDEQTRLGHILHQMVYAIAVTELTSLMARRTIYCSKNAASTHSVVTMPTPDGNVWFERIEHDYDSRGRCQRCGASRDQFRDPSLDNHAYGFIHEQGRQSIAKEFNVQFDVVVGNPPYQMSDGGYGASATPIYHHFVETAIDLGARYVVMVTPSRWFSGGKGLNDFRARMLKDHHLRNLVDYPKLYDGFPGLKIRGGISYFLWDRNYDGPCTVQTMWDGEPLGPSASRSLDTYDVLIRRNEAVSVLDKVQEYRVVREPEATLDQRVSSRKPFAFPTDFHGVRSGHALDDPVKLHGSQRISWIERSDIQHNDQWVDRWKVLMTAVQGTSAAVETMFLSKPIIAGPSEACSETYLVAGHFDSEDEAKNFASYLRTRTVRFLVSLRKPTQHATRGVYAFVPDVPFDREWTDEALYERYGITAEEQAFIEATVNEMPE